MQKIILTLAIVFGGLMSAQNYYDTYPTEYNGYEYYDNSYDYPDNYYYNYPMDYYPDQYYQGYYDDYQSAVMSVNWNQFFAQHRLSPFQINQVLMLNNRFASYNAWNSYYRWNPDRWYYDRFYALQNILGPRVFVVYQNVYFQGSSPFVYYRNRNVNFYAVRYPVRPVYRNVNINIYKVNRGNFREDFRNIGRNQGMINTNRNQGMRNNQPRSGSNGNIGGMRSNDNSGIRTQNDNVRNNGLRNESPRNLSNGNNLGGIRSQRNEGVRTNDNSGIRNQGGMRQNQNSERRIESSSSNQRNSAPQSENGRRSSGSRFTSR